jgi:hypothetical protein
MAVDSLQGSVGPYGHLHLVGNLWEPVSDIWHPKTYGDGTERTDPGGPTGEGYQVIRGGGFDTFTTNMRLANRMSALVDGSSIGVRCARPIAEPQMDAVAALSTRTQSGTVLGLGPLNGKALYVTAFSTDDTDQGRLRPGASPLAETRLVPNRTTEQAFVLEVPAVPSFYLFSSMDAGMPEPGKPPSGTGGVGRLASPIDGTESHSGLRIQLEALPGVVPIPSPKNPPLPPGIRPRSGQKR